MNDDTFYFVLVAIVLFVVVIIAAMMYSSGSGAAKTGGYGGGGYGDDSDDAEGDYEGGEPAPFRDFGGARPKKNPDRVYVPTARAIQYHVDDAVLGKISAGDKACDIRASGKYLENLKAGDMVVYYSASSSVACRVDGKVDTISADEARKEKAKNPLALLDDTPQADQYIKFNLKVCCKSK